MNFYDKFLIFFHLKKRSTPERENWMEYAAFQPYSFKVIFSDANMLFLGAVIATLFNQYFSVLVMILIGQRILSRFGDEVDAKYNKGYEPQMMVNMIQCNHMQSLKEMFISNPNLINAKYKNKSLLYWAKYYNNLQAHKMIIDLMKEKNIQIHESA